MKRLADRVVDLAHEQIDKGCCSSHYRQVLDHDRTCTSLHNVWLPRCRGASGCDIESCGACDLIFADSIGLVYVELACGTEVSLCECCTR